MDTGGAGESCGGYWRDGLVCLEGGFLGMMLGKMHDNTSIRVRLTTDREVRVWRENAHSFCLYADACTGLSAGLGEASNRCGACQKEFANQRYYRRALLRERETTEKLDDEHGLDDLLEHHSTYPHRLREGVSRNNLEKIMYQLTNNHTSSILQLPSDMLGARLLESKSTADPPASASASAQVENKPVRTDAAQERYLLLEQRKEEHAINMKKRRRDGRPGPELPSAERMAIPTAEEERLREEARADEAKAAASENELTEIQLSEVTVALWENAAEEAARNAEKSRMQSQFDNGQWHVNKEVERQQAHLAKFGEKCRPVCRSARTILDGCNAAAESTAAAATPTTTADGKSLRDIISEFKESGMLDIGALEEINGLDIGFRDQLHLHLTDRCVLVDIMHRLMMRIEGKEPNRPVSTETSDRLYRLYLSISGAAFSAVMNIFPISSTKGMGRLKRKRMGKIHDSTPFKQFQLHCKIFNAVLAKMHAAGASDREILMARLTMLMMDGTKLVSSLSIDWANKIMLGISSCATAESMFRKVEALRSSASADESASKVKDASLASNVVQVWSVVMGMGKLSELLINFESVVTENCATVASMSWEAFVLDQCCGHVTTAFVTDCLAANKLGLKRFQRWPALYTMQGADKPQGNEERCLVRADHPAYGYGEKNSQLPEMLGRHQVSWRPDMAHSIIKSPTNAVMGKPGLMLVDEVQMKILPLPFTEFKEVVQAYLKTKDRRPAGSLNILEVLNRSTNSKLKMKVAPAAAYSSNRMQDFVGLGRNFAADRLRKGDFSSMAEKNKYARVFNAIPAWLADAKVKDKANDVLNGWDTDHRKRGNGEGPKRVLKFVGLHDTRALEEMLEYPRRLERHAGFISRASTVVGQLSLVANFAGRVTIDNAMYCVLAGKSIITQLASSFPGSVHSLAHTKGDGYELNFNKIKTKAGPFCSIENFLIATEKVVCAKFADFERWMRGLPISSNEGRRRSSDDVATYSRGGNNSEANYDGYDQSPYLEAENGPAPVVHTIAKKQLSRRTDAPGLSEMAATDFVSCDFNPMGSEDPEDVGRRFQGHILA